MNAKTLMLGRRRTAARNKAENVAAGPRNEGALRGGRRDGAPAQRQRDAAAGPVEFAQQLSLQSLLSRALASVADAIFITDKMGRIVWVNDAFCRLSGYAPHEAIGCSPAILQSGIQSQAFYAELWQTIAAGKVWQGEVVDRRKDGSFYTVDEIITPLFDEHGSITNFIAIQHDITLRKHDSERDHHLAYHDVLTGLPNRANFLRAQEMAIAKANNASHKLAILFLDLDRFKPVNDNFGHHVGDQVLVAVAERLRAALRRTDVVARLGGDEFGILLTEQVDTSVATALARKLLRSLSRPFMIDGIKIVIGSSIGVALYPTDGDDAERLLAKADKAMYRAKGSGGNDYRLVNADDAHVTHQSDTP